MKKHIQIAVLLFCGLIAVSCTKPPIQPYPYEPKENILAKGQQISDTLEAYIRDWLAGRVPAMIPVSILPPTMLQDDNDPNKPHGWIRDVRLAPFGSIDPNVYTMVRPAEIINPAALKANNPDPHYTYMFLQLIHLAPFGSSTVIKGQFPYCRFFQITPTPPLNGTQYSWWVMGPPENPIIDVDIEPDSGSVNPFRVGANRNATNRNYTITILNRIDNVATAPDQYAPKAPYYRGNSNTRYGSGILYKGPGLYGPADGKNPGWQNGLIWARYALPDGYGKPGFDPLAKVGCPSVYHQLASGEKFHIVCDPNSANKNMNIAYASYATSTAPTSPYQDANFGWWKSFGILNSAVTGMCTALGWTTADDRKYCRDLIRGVEGRGYDITAPGNWEGSATCVNYCNYMGRGFGCETGKVVVLTGKMPTFPKTIDGQSSLPAANMRYWSLCGYECDNADANRQEAICYNSVCDEQVILDPNRNFVICYSRSADKPANANSSARVTWVDWGVHGGINITWRWVSVYPDWYFSKSPTDEPGRLDWARTDWPVPTWDQNLIGRNVRTGWLGEYLPKINYMSKAKFESMGTPVTWAKVDAIAWNACGTAINTNGKSGLLALIPLFLLLFVNIVWNRKKR